ncbi:MAG: T9SS type A sorting domain-containing protein [Bacteroidota bacterium]
MRFLLIISAALVAFSAKAQQGPVLTKGTVPLLNVFEPDSLVNTPNGIFTIASELPEPAGIDKATKTFVNNERTRLQNNHYPSNGLKRAAVPPMVTGGFIGAVNEGTPNDNNMAVNNDSFAISVLNTYIRVFNTSGVVKKNWGLENFPRDPKNTRPGTGVDILNRSYDPKIVFDPIANRFIIVYLEGSESPDTRIIVAFSKTNNPLDGWNVYNLNGNPFGGLYWTDYPMIAINGEDLFITVNILKDNTDWRTGFTQSVIWQVQKKGGYTADSLQFNLWSNLVYNNKPIWNICPVQDAYQPGSDGMYFLSARPGDVSNDSFFLHRITNSVKSGTAQYYFDVLKSNKSYGLPPAAPQKQAGFMLQTNDARVLGAFYNNDKIQFVQTSRNAINGKSSIYHGIIQDPHKADPIVTANIISYDSLDIAYPTIVHAGNKVFGRQSLITFSHSGPNTFPGTSLVYFDNNGQYSDLIRVKEGQGYINSFIPDSTERWGDYTSIQRRDNNENEYWLVGSYGKATNAVGTWIGVITMNDPSVKVKDITANQLQNNAYPNPVKDQLVVPFHTDAAGTVSFFVTDASGKVVITLKEEQTNGEQKAFINVSQLATGLYTYTILLNNVPVNNGKFSKI